MLTYLLADNLCVTCLHPYKFTCILLTYVKHTYTPTCLLAYNLCKTSSHAYMLTSRKLIYKLISLDVYFCIAYVKHAYMLRCLLALRDACKVPRMRAELQDV
jgi:hypothetical protein